ncbi:MAG: hypothetical protein GZ091_16285 [Paludibacter sp.]|nr:hypothetical protein [Paludibacter sp.]
MKLKTILSFFILSSWLANYPIAAQNCERDSLLYLTAFNYILKDSINHNNSIAVSDSIIDLDRFWFSKGLENFPNEKELLNQYRANKGYKWFKPYHSKLINLLFCRQKNEQKVLFFSPIENNILRADLLPINQRSKDIFDYNKLASFTEGYQYLFIFNNSKTIKLALCRKIIYD